MDVTSHCPLSIGALFWQPSSGAWALTVACKATFRLVPGTLALHDAREDIHPEEVYLDGDRSKGLRAPCDLVPRKPVTDVLAVGHAFAPGAPSIPSVLARITIGNVDKSIEAVRARGSGDRSEAAAFGRPFVLPGGGFGPESLSRPEAVSRLGALAGSFGPFGWRTRPLPAGLDPAFFQSAPPDQRTPHLRGDETLVLSHLHPEHAALRTKLPGLRPRAVLERADAPARPLAAAADTLWIDTDRALVTLVWRVQTAVLHPAEPGSVTITLETLDGRRVESDARIQSIHAGELASEWSRLPARDGDAPDEEEAAEVDPLNETARLPARRGSAGGSAIGTLPTGTVLDRDSALPFQGAAPKPAPAPALPFQKPEVPPALSGSLGERLAGRAMGPLPADRAQEPAASPASPERAGRRRIGAADGPEVPAVRTSAPAVGSALAFSNAAAGIASMPVAAAPAAVVPSPSASVKPGPVEAIELVWFDEGAPAKLRDRADWKKLLAPERQQRRDPSDERTPEQRRDARHRREVGTILQRVTPADMASIERAMKEAVVGGVLTPPLLVIAGDLEPLLDEVKALEATLAAAAPFAAGDKRLRESLEWAREVLQTPGFDASVGVAEGVTAKVAEAFGEARRALPTGYLDTHVERSLLRRRCYQRRSLLGAEQLRATLRVHPGAEPVAAYLPEATATLLPMFRVFRARVVAEALPSREPGESVALQCLALAIVVKGA